MSRNDKADSADAVVPSGQSAHEILKSLVARIFARAENFVAGRYWTLEVLFLAVMFTVLFSGGVDDRLSVASGNDWFPAYFKKIEHPLMDVAKGIPPQNHEAKLNFRLTVPVVLHVLQVPADQHWVLPVLAACGTCAVIFISCIFAFRVTEDRVCGLFTALAVCSTYIGSFGFALYYDTIAIAQLALAMLPGLHWTFKGILVFTASFTDERAFVAAPLLLVQSFCSAQSNASVRERLLRLDSLAVIGGMACYLAGRLALEQFTGLTSPHEGTGLELLFGNFPFWHAGIWLALKGGWLLICVAALCLWQRGQFFLLAAFIFAAALSVGSGFLVDDVVRSTAYVFPALLVALMVAAKYENIYWMRVYCLAAFVISAVTGNYTIWRSQITWFKPVAARVLYHILHAIFKTPLSG